MLEGGGGKPDYLGIYLYTSPDRDETAPPMAPSMAEIHRQVLWMIQKQHLLMLLAGRLYGALRRSKWRRVQGYVSRSSKVEPRAPDLKNTNKPAS